MSDLSVGGQAVIEGVMMRSKDRVSTAMRIPSGEILVKTEEYTSLTKRYKILSVPVFRGIITFFEMLVIGIKTLNLSADISMKEIEKEEAAAKGEEYVPRDTKSGNLILVGTVIFALLVGIGIFFFLPLALATLIGIERDALPFNLLAGAIRIIIFLIYIWVISMFGEFKRVFQYHGAEHKSIYAFEKGEKLTTENVSRHTTLHPRCGTSFIIIVALMAILIYSISDTVFAVLVGSAPNLLERFAVHFSLLPLVAGGSYELLRLSGKTQNNPITRIFIKPGLWLQKITTKEPTVEQMEVAIVALESALGVTESNLSVKKTCL